MAGATSRGMASPGEPPRQFMTADTGKSGDILSSISHILAMDVTNF